MLLFLRKLFFWIILLLLNKLEALFCSIGYTFCECNLVFIRLKNYVPLRTESVINVKFCASELSPKYFVACYRRMIYVFLTPTSQETILPGSHVANLLKFRGDCKAYSLWHTGVLIDFSPVFHFKVQTSKFHLAYSFQFLGILLVLLVVKIHIVVTWWVPEGIAVKYISQIIILAFLFSH